MELNKFTEAAVTVFTAIIGVAILALLVSPKATTAQVLQNTFSGVANDLGVAESPVTGETYHIDTSYANNGSYAGSIGMPSFDAMPQLG